MRRRSLYPAIAMVAFSVIGCDAPISTAASGPALAKANTVRTNEWIIVDPTTIEDPCSGEQIIVSGKGHLVQTVTDPGDGTLVARGHINYAGISGYGVTSGLKYQLVATQKVNEIETLVGNATRVQQHVGFISQGSRDNYQQHAVVEYGFDGTDFYYIEIRARESCAG